MQARRLHHKGLSNGFCSVAVSAAHRQSPILSFSTNGGDVILFGYY